MEWTKEQKRIIDIRNSNILVSAAAGSGKTAVLVERIINIVKNENVDIDRFLVVTFTNAAAAGMKQKIQKALVKAAQEDAGNIRHIRRQLNLLNKAQITTLHSFCMEVVRKNFHLLGIDPSFRIGDNNELSILLQESIDEVLERAYSKGEEDFRLLVEAFTKNREDNDLSTIIRKAYKFILSFPDPLIWLENGVNYINITEDEFKNSLWFKEINEYAKMQLDGAREIINVGIEICEEPDGPDKYKETLLKDLEIVDELRSSLEADFIAFVKDIHDFKAPTLKGYKKEDPALIEVKEEKLIEIKEKLRNEYKDIINGLKKLFTYNTLDKYVEEIKSMYTSMSALKDLIIDLHNTYKGNKIDKGIVDFNDLEHYALEVLRNKGLPSDIAKSYQNKFDYIFIDEYQDSNSIQETIIEQLRRNNNLFMVGDVKQSIYRFRLADPSIFNKKYTEYEHDSEDLKEEIIDRIIELNKNFRSRKEILDATNYVFSNIMSKDLGEIDYSENAHLNCGVEFPNANSVELNIIEKNSTDVQENNDNNDDSDIDIVEEIESLETAEWEARFAVKKIRELINQDTYDNSKGELRKIDYKDIVILLRSVKNWSNIFEEVFNREGIPFYFDGGSGYYETIEIQLIVNLLKLVDNVKQDIALISVMRSPIGNFTTEDLIEIRARYPHGKYYDACHKYKNSLDHSAELIKKLDEFFNKINRWSIKSKYIHLNDLVWEILMETNYYHFVGALPNGKVRQANLRLFTDKAYEFEKTSMRGLFKFLRYIEKLNNSSEDKTSTAKTLGENDNVVRLMTIHTSKGLEFPVVILCGLNKRFNIQDITPKILMHKEYGIGTKYINVEKRVEYQTLSRKAISNKITLENLSEEMRVLYVAMTRAIDKLIMVGSISNLDNKIKKWRRGHSRYFIYKGTSYLDWICSCLFEGVNLEGLNDILVKGQYKDWNVSRVTYSEIMKGSDKGEKKDIEDKLKELESFNNINVEIERRLNFKYNYDKSVKTPTKLSVTESKSLDLEKLESLRYNIPALSNFLEYDEKSKKFQLDKVEFSGAEIGTLIHLVMENIDIKGKLDKSDLINQLQCLASRNILTASEESFIINRYLDKIEAFYKSDIGIRLKKSNWIKREAPFVLKKKASEMLNNFHECDDILIQGVIDCYFYEGDDVVIIDYKTDSVKDSDIEDIKMKYRSQISLYREALEKIEKKKVKEAYLYLMSIGKAVAIQL